jgi:hypothetical protein
MALEILATLCAESSWSAQPGRDSRSFSVRRIPDDRAGVMNFFRSARLLSLATLLGARLRTVARADELAASPSN